MLKTSSEHIAFICLLSATNNNTQGSFLLQLNPFLLVKVHQPKRTGTDVQVRSRALFFLMDMKGVVSCSSFSVSS